MYSWSVNELLCGGSSLLTFREWARLTSYIVAGASIETTQGHGQPFGFADTIVNQLVVLLVYHAL
jgi:hypothetical protein